MFVEQQMGTKFVTHGAMDLKEMFEESSARTPLIFILSPGKAYYIIRSYGDVIVVTKIATRRTSKAKNIVMY